MNFLIPENLKDRIIEIPYKDCLVIWKTKLWVDRISKIEPMSQMALNKNFSENICSPFYYAYVEEGRIVGVNSIHSVDNTIRSRGLWVNPYYRKNGIGKTLLRVAIANAVENNMKCWSYPRQEALSVYLKAGFQQVSSLILDTLDSKTNCYVAT